MVSGWRLKRIFPNLNFNYHIYIRYYVCGRICKFSPSLPPTHLALVTTTSKTACCMWMNKGEIL